MDFSSKRSNQLWYSNSLPTSHFLEWSKQQQTALYESIYQNQRAGKAVFSVIPNNLPSVKADSPI
jgi:hypothetical protein